MAARRDLARERQIIDRYLNHTGSVDEILDEFNISRQTLYSILRRNEVQPKTAARRSEPSPEVVEALRAILRLSQAYFDEQVGERFFEEEVRRYARRWLTEDDDTSGDAPAKSGSGGARRRS